MSNYQEILEVVWPRATRQADVLEAAPRLDTLDGKTVCQLWDFLFRGDEVFDLLETGLKELYPNVNFISWKEFGSTHGADEREILANLPAKMKTLGVDAVISGMGC